jgi:hypothetical protein
VIQHEPPALNRVAFGDAASPSDAGEHRSPADRSSAPRASSQRRPTLGRLPWLAFLRRDRAFRLAVRFDIEVNLP